MQLDKPKQINTNYLFTLLSLKKSTSKGHKEICFGLLSGGGLPRHPSVDSPHIYKAPNDVIAARCVSPLEMERKYKSKPLNLD